MKQNTDLPPGWGGDSYQENPWGNAQESGEQKFKPTKPESAAPMQQLDSHASSPVELPKPGEMIEKLKQGADSAKSAAKKAAAAAQDKIRDLQRADDADTEHITQDVPVQDDVSVPEQTTEQEQQDIWYHDTETKPQQQPSEPSAPDTVRLAEKPLSDLQNQPPESDSFSPLLILVPIVIIVLAFVGGLLFMKYKNTHRQKNHANAEYSVAEADEVPVTTSNAEKSEETDAATTETTAVEQSDSQQPTITAAYMHWVNTGIGLDFYIHVEGEYATYTYECYASGANNGIPEYRGTSDQTEMLIADGLGTLDFDSYQALVTVWNQDSTLSKEQLVYIDAKKCDTGSTPKSNASISSAKIIGEYNDIGDGYVYRLDATGNYSYWVAEVTEKQTSAETRTFTVSSRDLTANYPYLCGGNLIEELRAVVTPYDVNGNPGKPYSVKWNPQTDVEYVKVSEDVYDNTVSDVYACGRTGLINTHGGTVPGYASSYIRKDGSVAYVRKSLGDGWHITTERYCYFNERLMYELYDAWDGDYYGWVDSDYLDFD